MVALLSRLFGKSAPAPAYAPIDEEDADTYTKESTKVPSLFFVSPAQLWIGSLIARVNKAGEIEPSWLPQFKRNATTLRALYEPLQSGGVWPFLMQFEIGGMLLLGALLEVRSPPAAVCLPNSCFC